MWVEYEVMWVYKASDHFSRWIFHPYDHQRGSQSWSRELQRGSASAAAGGWYIIVWFVWMRREQMNITSTAYSLHNVTHFIIHKSVFFCINNYMLHLLTFFENVIAPRMLDHLSSSSSTHRLENTATCESINVCSMRPYILSLSLTSSHLWLPASVFCILS